MFSVDVNDLLQGELLLLVKFALLLAVVGLREMVMER